VGLDESLSRGHGIAHEHLYNLSRFHRILDGDPERFSRESMSQTQD
jgi:hypothetical protein